MDNGKDFIYYKTLFHVIFVRRLIKIGKFFVLWYDGQKTEFSVKEFRRWKDQVVRIVETFEKWVRTVLGWFNSLKVDSSEDAP